MLSAGLSLPNVAQPAMPLAGTTGTPQRFVRPGPLVLGTALSIFLPRASDRDRLSSSTRGPGRNEPLVCQFVVPGQGQWRLATFREGLNR